MVHLHALNMIVTPAVLMNVELNRLDTLDTSFISNIYCIGLPAEEN